MNKNNEFERNEVCEKYEQYFNNKLDIDCLEFKKELFMIYKLATMSKKDIVLGCWCYPKKCHAETIKKYIEMNENLFNKKE